MNKLEDLRKELNDQFKQLETIRGLNRTDKNRSSQIIRSFTKKNIMKDVYRIQAEIGKLKKKEK